MDFMLIQSYLEKLPNLEQLSLLPEIKNLMKKFGNNSVEEKLLEILDARHLVISTAKSEDLVKKLDFSMDFYISEILAFFKDEKDQNIKKIINCMGTIYSDFIGGKFYSKELLRDFSDNYSYYNNFRYNVNKGKEIIVEEEITKLLKTYNRELEYLVFSNFSGAIFTLLNTYFKDYKIISSIRESYTFENDLDLNRLLDEFSSSKKVVGSLNKISIGDYKKEISDKSLLLLSDFYGNGLEGLAKLKDEEFQDLVQNENSLFISDRFYLATNNKEIISRAIDFSKTLGKAKLIMADFSKNEDLPNCVILAGNKEIVDFIKNSSFYKMFYPSKEIETLLYFSLTKKTSDKKENTYLENVLLLDEGKLKKRNLKFVEELQKTLENKAEIGLLEGPYLKVEEGVSYKEAFNRELIVINPLEKTCEEIDLELKNSETPVLCWINEGSLLINLQLVDKKDEKTLLEVLSQVIKK